MKESRILYVFVIILILIGFFSVKTTIKKMQESGQEVDLMFYQITAEYEKMNKVFSNMEKILADQFPLLLDSLQLHALPEISENLNSEKLDFEIFNKNRLFQNTLSRNFEIVLAHFGENHNDNPELIESCLDSLVDREQSILVIEKAYNNRAGNHNAFIKKFPRNFYSSFFHFQSKPYF